MKNWRQQFSIPHSPFALLLFVLQIQRLRQLIELSLVLSHRLFVPLNFVAINGTNPIWLFAHLLEFCMVNGFE
jgi:hypothetical protein